MTTEIREIQAFVYAAPAVQYVTWPGTYVRYVLAAHQFRQELLAEMGTADSVAAYGALASTHPSRCVSPSLAEAFVQLRTFVRDELGIAFMPGEVYTNRDAAVQVAKVEGLHDAFIMMLEDLAGI